MDTNTINSYPLLHSSHQSEASNMDTTQNFFPVNLTGKRNSSCRFNFDSALDSSAYHLKTSLPYEKLEFGSNEAENEFSTEFSPETLTKNVSSALHDMGGLWGGWNGLQQVWQTRACIPFRGDEITEFQRSIDANLSVENFDPDNPEHPLRYVGVDATIAKKDATVLESADEAFWAKSTTRRPAPGTEWEFENRVSCVARGKEREGFAWGGQGEGGIDGEKETEGQGDLRDRNGVAVSRLKSVLAHLAV